MNPETAAEIICGTYDHDHFKPFWLGNPAHALLGYAEAYATQPGREAYALAILLHSTGAAEARAKLAWHNLLWQREKPATEGSGIANALVAGPLVDRIASASYAMVNTAAAARNHEMLGQWPAAVQNPFSRLPMLDPAVTDQRLCRTDLAGTDFANEFFRRLLLGNDQAILDDWDGCVRRLVRAMRDEPTPATVVDVTAQWDKLVGLLRGLTTDQRALVAAAYGAFAERTFPHPNDTPLRLHTRLAANLFHLILQNTAAGSWLEGAALESADQATLQEWLAEPGQPPPARRAEAMAQIRGWMVTVTLAGIEERFRAAVRLDDLQGAKLLAARVRHAFKRRMLEALGFAPDTPCTAADGTGLGEILCLQESEFGLTYLLPKTWGAGETALRARLQQVYDAALADVVSARAAASQPPASALGQSPATLVEVLQQDIDRVIADSGCAGTFTLQASPEVILAGLKALPPAFGVSGEIAPAGEDEESLGEQLVAALQEAGDPYWSGEAVAALWAEAQPAPAWVELAEHAFGRKAPALPLLQKFFHAFRDEEEELSQLSAALRALAHGYTQVEELAQFIRAGVPIDGEVKLEFASKATTGGQQAVPAPPLLQQRATIGRSNGQVDLGACFVRMRRNPRRVGEAEEWLDRFPTVTYAADADGNVAMLTLRPTPQLAGGLVMPPALVDTLLGTDETFAGVKAAEDLRTFYWNADKLRATPALRPVLETVQPHVARVLQRQQVFTRFLQRLPLRLAAAGVRVLTLEERYPLGRYLVPAALLTTALDVLDRSLCLDLLSVRGEDLGLDDMAVQAARRHNVLDPASEAAVVKRAGLRRLLAEYIPGLVTGSAVVFGHKQALYLALRAEERLSARPAEQPVLTLRLSDLRGTLVDRAPLHGEYSFVEWEEVRRIVNGVDRRSLAGLAGDIDRLAQHRGGLDGRGGGTYTGGAGGVGACALGESGDGG